MDKKTGPTHMLPSGDPPQKKRLTQTESEGLETNISSKWKERKKSQGTIIHIGQNRLQKRAIIRDSECHFMILNGRIHQEDTKIVNIYVPNIGVPKYINKI